MKLAMLACGKSHRKQALSPACWQGRSSTAQEDFVGRTVLPSASAEGAFFEAGRRQKRPPLPFVMAILLLLGRVGTSVVNCPAQFGRIYQDGVDHNLVFWGIPPR